MDIASHFIAGASVGIYYGKPLIGGFLGILPDLVLGLQRKAEPTKLYRVTHSFLFLLLVTALFAYTSFYMLVFWALFSHLLLDYFTHGPMWSPNLFYPSKRTLHLKFISEWEFFNSSWTLGFILTFIWSVFWIAMSNAL